MINRTHSHRQKTSANAKPNRLQALRLLPESGVQSGRVSSIYETSSGYLDQEMVPGTRGS